MARCAVVTSPIWRPYVQQPLRHTVAISWNIVLSNAHFTYAEPSPAGLRFQAYTTLAYGGRGISYFTYVSPNSGNYRLAPIDQFGHKTPTWEMLRNVNLQIHALAPTMITTERVESSIIPTCPRLPALADSQYLADVNGAGRLRRRIPTRGHPS